MLTQERTDAGHIVLCQAVVRINHQSPFRPFFGPSNLAKNREPHSSQVRRSRVSRMQHELALGTLNPLPCRPLHFLLTPERSVYPGEYKQGLIIVWLKLCRTLEKPGRFLSLP